MARSLEMWVEGRARPAGSKSAIPAINRRTGALVLKTVGSKWGPVRRPIFNMIDSGDNVEWKRAVATAGLVARGDGDVLNGGVFLFVLAVRQRPLRHYVGGSRDRGVRSEYVGARPTSKPDATKLGRCVEDALTGVWWADDNANVLVAYGKTYGSGWGAWIRACEAPVSAEGDGYTFARIWETMATAIARKFL